MAVARFSLVRRIVNSKEVVCERSAEQLYHWITGVRVRDLFGLTPEFIHSDFTISRSKLMEIADWRNKFSS